MLDGEISKRVDIYKELHRDVHHHPVCSRYRLQYINDMVVQSKHQSKESRWGKIRCRG